MSDSAPQPRTDGAQRKRARIKPTSRQTDSFGPDRNEIDAVVRQFGVATEQAERDHLISHILGALSHPDLRGRLLFFGGTALSRTHLPDLRLSEDIDLIAHDKRSEVAAIVANRIEHGLARSHGAITWMPNLSQTRGSDPAVLSVAGTTLRVQVQLLSEDGYPKWPTESIDMHQRYSDAPPSYLEALTPSGFVAAKLAAWHDRQTPRDLYDLWALSERGHFGPEAIRLYRQLGPTGGAPKVSMFDEVPSNASWQAALAHQCQIRIGPTDAAAVVRRALVAAN